MHTRCAAILCMGALHIIFVIITLLFCFFAAANNGSTRLRKTVLSCGAPLSLKQNECSPAQEPEGQKCCQRVNKPSCFCVFLTCILSGIVECHLKLLAMFNFREAELKFGRGLHLIEDCFVLVMAPASIITFCVYMRPITALELHVNILLFFFFRQHSCHWGIDYPKLTRIHLYLPRLLLLLLYTVREKQPT